MLGRRRLHLRWLVLLADNFRLCLQPIVDVMAMLSATLLKQLVSAQADVLFREL